MTTIVEQILACPMDQNDAYADTVGEYLSELLKEVWTQEQGFSGKRPFGNSAWQWEVYEALGKAGIIQVTYNEWEEPELADHSEVDTLIRQAIEFAFLGAGHAGS